MLRPLLLTPADIGCGRRGGRTRTRLSALPCAWWLLSCAWAPGCGESLASSLSAPVGDTRYASWSGDQDLEGAPADPDATDPGPEGPAQGGAEGARSDSVDGGPGDAGPALHDPDDDALDDAGEDAAGGDSLELPAVSPDSADPGPGCPAGVVCVDSLPFSHEADTAAAAPGVLDGYSCAPDTSQAGPEVLYRVEVPEDGFLSAAVYDGAGVDVDVHILASPSASTCLARGHHDAAADVTAGTWWVSVDSWTNAEGVPQAGPYRVEIGLVVPSLGPCGLATGLMPRVGDGGVHLAMPATGPVVMEAHLVTQEEPAPYPATPTEELAGHYELSQGVSGLVMFRDQVRAPLEGGSFYGAGIGSPSLFPVLDEAWYVNMYWTASARPDRGTRMILRVPGTDRAVVVAGGYETGPGDLSNIGGTTEETHLYLGTGHKSTLTLGIATDPLLPLGPRRCTDDI